MYKLQTSIVSACCRSLVLALLVLGTHHAHADYASTVQTVTGTQPADYWQLNGTTTNLGSKGGSATFNGSGNTVVSGPQPPAYAGFSSGNTAVGVGSSASGLACGTGAAITGTGDFSVVAWVKTTASGSANGYEIVCQRDNSGSGYNGTLRVYMDSAGRVHFWVYESGFQWTSGSDSSSISTPLSYNDGNWHQIVCVRAGAVGSIYLDGVSVASTTGTAAKTLNSLGVYIGYNQRDSWGYFNGSIAQAAIYTSALTAGNVTSLYAAAGSAAYKAASGTDLTAGPSWVKGAAPASDNFAMWTSTSLGSGLTLGSAASWRGVSLSGAASDVGISGAGALTLGAGGIDMSASTSNLTLANDIALGASQVWGVNSGKTLTSSGVISGASALAASGQTLSYSAFLPASPSTVKVFAGQSLANVTSVGGLVGGLAIPTPSGLAGTVYNYVNTGTTATFQLQYQDGVNVKGCVVQLSQSGSDIYGSVLGAWYKAGSAGTLDLTTGNSVSIATSTGVYYYGCAGVSISVGRYPGTGTIVLSGANTYSGGTTVNAGQLHINNGGSSSANSAIGTGPLTLAGGTLDNTSSSDVTLVPTIAQSWNGNFTYAGSLHNLNLGTGTVTLGASSQVSVTANTLTVGGNISGAGLNLTTAGAGTLELAGGGSVANLQPDAGTLAISGGAYTAAQFANSDYGTTRTSTVNQTGGTVTLGAAGTYYGSRGPTQAITYHLSGGTLDATAGRFYLAWDGGSGTNPTFTVSGGGLLKVYGLDRANTTTGGNAGTLNLSGGQITIGANGIGNSNSTGTGVVNALNFGGGTIAASTAFSGNSGQAITLTGTGGNTTFDTTGGDMSLNGVLNGAGGLVKAGSGTLTLNNTETYSGATRINAGTLALGASGALNAASSISLAAGATFDVSALPTYTLGSSAMLSAAGNASAATLKGGTEVSLGSSPIALTWGGASSGTDSTHPALTVSQGTLSLSGNTFSVVVAGAPLDVGVYTLVTTPAAITGSVNFAPSFTGNGMIAGDVGIVSISGNDVILTVTQPSATLVATGSLLAPLTTTYGTPSGENSFTVAGTTLTAGVTVTPPAGFELSTTSGSGYAGSGVAITVGSGPTVATTTVYVRLAANAPVAGTYNSQTLVLTSPLAVDVTIATAATGNSVAPKALTVASATAQDKVYDGTPTATVTATLQTAEIFGTGTSGDGFPYTGDDLTLTCSAATFATAAIGAAIPVTAGIFTLGGNSAGDYTLTQPGELSLTANILNWATWTNLAGGAWPTTGNWLNGVGNGADITADFGTLALAANPTVALDGPRTIGNLIFNDQSPIKHTWTLNTGSAGPLTLAVSSGSPMISNNVTTTIGAVLATSNGLTKTGAGTLTLTGKNFYSGTTTLNAGMLVLGMGPDYAGSHVGDAVLINTGATLRLTAPHATGFAHSLVGSAGEHAGGSAANATVNAGGTFDRNGQDTYIENLTMTGNAVVTGTGGLNLCVNLSATSDGSGSPVVSSVALVGGTYTDAGNTHTLTVIHGAGSAATSDLSIGFIGEQTQAGATHMIKGGNGTLTLTGASSYTGTTTVNAGTLLVNGSLAAASAVSVNALATLGGSGTVNGPLTVAGTIAPGTGTGTGTLSTAALTLSGTYQCQLDGDNCDLLAASGSLTLTGSTLALSEITTPTAASYIIVSYTGTAPAFTAVTGLPTGYALDYTTPDLIKLVKSAGFSAWIDTFTFAAGADKTPTGDPDGDGVSNLMEYALAGRNPTLSDGAPGVFNGTLLSFSKRPEAAADANLTYAIQKSDDLGVTDAWTEVATYTENNATTISFTLPAGKTQTFARLVVTQLP